MTQKHVKQTVEGIVHGIMMLWIMTTACLVVIWVYQWYWTPLNQIVQTVPERSEKELRVAMRHHGEQYLTKNDSGEWVFYRNNQECRAFKEGN